MSFIYWTQDLDTGIDGIDTQHKILVDHINKLYDAHQSGDYEQTKKELADMIDYTVFHFGEEEEMLVEANYKLVEAHKKVHANFVSKMATLQGSYENGDLEAVKEVLDLCEGWLFRHIRLNDHGYVDPVKASGITPKLTLPN